MSKSWMSSYTFSHPFASISVLQDCLTFKKCLMYKGYLVCLCFEFLFASWLCCVYFYDILFHAHHFHQSNVTSCVSYCSLEPILQTYFTGSKGPYLDVVWVFRDPMCRVILDPVYEISGFHGGEFEKDSLLGYSAVKIDVWGAYYLHHQDDERQPGYTALYPRRPSSPNLLVWRSDSNLKLASM
jgi:hypothetical protein